MKWYFGASSTPSSLFLRLRRRSLKLNTCQEQTATAHHTSPYNAMQSPVEVFVPRQSNAKPFMPPLNCVIL